MVDVVLGEQIGEGVDVVAVSASANFRAIEASAAKAHEGRRGAPAPNAAPARKHLRRMEPPSAEKAAGAQYSRNVAKAAPVRGASAAAQTCGRQRPGVNARLIHIPLAVVHVVFYSRAMDAEKLTPANPADLADALAFALRFQGRKRIHNADEIMAGIVARRLVEHLEKAGFVVMRKPADVGAAALGRGYEG